MGRVEECWTRIEAWLRVYAPAEVLASLNPPASEEQIGAAEAALRVNLPTDVRASFRIHDGQKRGRQPIAGVEFYPLTEVLASWRSMRQLKAEGHFDGIQSDPDEFTRSDGWHEHWIPVGDLGGGGELFVDLAPGKKGTPGQVVAWHCHTGIGAVAAGGLEAWLAAVADDLEAGRLVYSRECRGVFYADEV
jgi:cell wall assembly regulator SMI1